MQNTLLHMSELRYSYTPTSYNAHGHIPQANAKHVGTLVSFFFLVELGYKCIKHAGSVPITC